VFSFLQVKDRIKAVKSATVHNTSFNSNVVPHTGSLQMLPIFLRVKGWLREDQSSISGYISSQLKRFIGKSTCIPQFHLLKLWQLLFIFNIISFKNSGHFSSIDVTPYILRRWRIVCAECGTVWSGEWVCSRWFCAVCVWLWVEGIKCGESVQQLALWCVSALCGCE